ncbi:eukaryotic initiation factor 4A-8-like [Pyrus ussuriensis x Pyrus communis]|uniref:ATP-dependent RNA helicase n=1 Tax=Pyrus ussuriensis x Pyrus communis TaxID=2448454 RepID=A0A5N5GCZ5_9ROSA|nr:eukaryotic initiation factor 4A-8-like [Pyrus ussuriensis x Pyrus communis]
MEGRDRRMLMAFFTGLGSRRVTCGHGSARVDICGAWRHEALGVAAISRCTDTPTDMADLGPEEQEVSYGEVDDNFFTPYDEVHENFDYMGLQENLLKGIYAYKRGIVPFCRFLDVIERAHPGTGKTAACCTGILQRLDYGLNQCQALVLTPRNDVALQTEKLMRALGKYLGMRVLPCVGGASVREDKQILQAGVHVVVGTPGSVFDTFHWDQALCRDHIKIFVLDEADELLTGGLKTRWKLEKISELYDSSITQTVIFVNTTDGVEWLADKMRHRNHAVSAIHADMDWDTCDAIVCEFHAGSCCVLITDDVMVDCIDAQHQQQQQESVTVVNYDLPDDLEDYVHRLGPSLGFRRKGHVICFVAREEERKLHDIQRFYNVDIKELLKLYPRFI